MANQENISSLEENLDSIINYKDKDLTKRLEWGAIHFKDAKNDIDLAFSIAEDLKRLPLLYLTDSACQNITNTISPIIEVFVEIDSFNLMGEPATRRDDIVRNLHSNVEQLNQSATPFIPYLAFRQGDVDKNIATLNSAISEAKNLLENTRKQSEEELNEIQNIASATRVAAAKAGVATFSEEFCDEAKKLKKLSRWWLLTTAILALLTISFAILFYFWGTTIQEEKMWEEIIRRVVSKITIIAVIFSATIWCGRIYRALLHQSTINQHRALSLKTFQAFVEATNDDRIKDSVLMSTTRAIFGRMATGLVNQNASEYDPEVNFLEIGRSSTKPNTTPEH
ncbi:MAG: hypothetical protein OXF20_10725 [Gammaproteobacteria bacterium]|nr:hypothetical protein [Gammaproteobacteria bacterium]